MLKAFVLPFSFPFVIAGLMAAVSTTPADAASPTRTFYCGNGQGTVKVKVVTQQSIKVTVDLGGDDGRFSMTMNQSGSGFRFVSGEYVLTIDGSQNNLQYSAPDYGTIGCVWRP